MVLENGCEIISAGILEQNIEGKLLKKKNESREVFIHRKS